MKYRTTQPFLAFGKCCEPGDIVELTDEQAAALNESDCIVSYETKVQPLPENKAAKKKPRRSASSQAGRVAPKKTRKSSKKKLTKR